MPIKTSRLMRALSIALSALSCIYTFMILPMYILGVALERGNLLQVIWPLSSGWPSILTIGLCRICVRGTHAHIESLTWQFTYIFFLFFPWGLLSSTMIQKGKRMQ